MSRRRQIIAWVIGIPCYTLITLVAITLLAVYRAPVDTWWGPWLNGIGAIIVGVMALAGVFALFAWPFLTFPLLYAMARDWWDGRQQRPTTVA